MCKYTVLIDTREKEPLFFEETDYCNGAIQQKLDTADYSLEGMKDVLAIERKACVSELANNCLEARFEKEMERLSNFKFKFLLCEFSFDDIMRYPIGSDIPKHKQALIKIRGPFILGFLSSIQARFNISIIYSGSKYNSKIILDSLFKKIYKYAKS